MAFTNGWMKITLERFNVSTFERSSATFSEEFSINLRFTHGWMKITVYMSET